MVLAPFFPRYLVAAIDISTPRRRSIYSTVGVSRIVCNGETPAPVYRQIDASPEARENERGFARLKQRSNFSVGDQARVVDGVLAGNLGLCAGMKDAERLPFF